MDNLIIPSKKPNKLHGNSINQIDKQNKLNGELDKPHRNYRNHSHEELDNQKTKTNKFDGELASSYGKHSNTNGKFNNLYRNSIIYMENLIVRIESS